MGHGPNNDDKERAARREPGPSEARSQRLDYIIPHKQVYVNRRKSMAIKANRKSEVWKVPESSVANRTFLNHCFCRIFFEVGVVVVVGKLLITLYKTTFGSTCLLSA